MRVFRPLQECPEMRLMAFVYIHSVMSRKIDVAYLSDPPFLLERLHKRAHKGSRCTLDDNAFAIFGVFGPHAFGLMLADKPAARDDEVASIPLVVLKEPPNLASSLLVGKPRFHLTMLALDVLARQFGGHALLGILKNSQL